MNNYEVGDVWLVNYPYEESEESKNRPAIIVDDRHVAVMYMYVTSRDKDEPYSVKIEDWRQAGLHSESFARIDRVMPIDECNEIKPLGSLSDRDFVKIITLYKKYILDDIRPFSLLAIVNHEGKFLQKYDKRWSCWLFPYFKTQQDNKEVSDKELSDILKRKEFTTYVAEAIHCKYSVSDKEYKIYNHKLYSYKLRSEPEHMTGNEFVIDGAKYSWMSIEQMENDSEIISKNSDIVNFVKKKVKK